MASVDPRLQQIPKQLLNDFEMRNYFEELERFLHDLWVRTGAGDDIISTTLEDESAILLARNNTKLIRELRDQLDSIPLVQSKQKQSDDVIELHVSNRIKDSGVDDMLAQILSKISRLEKIINTLENERT